MEKIKQSLKRIGLAAAVLLVIFSLNLIGGTNSYFVSDATITNNTFATADLSFSLVNPADNSLLTSVFNDSGVIPDYSKTETVRVQKNAGSIDFRYDVNYMKTGGDDSLCGALQLTAKLNGVTQYSGNLTSFSVPTATLDPSGHDDWDFTLSLTDHDLSLQNESCNFNFVFNGYQIGSDGTWGFTDYHFLTNAVSTGSWEQQQSPDPTVSAGDVVINEVMWMGSTQSSSDEWIELRNTTDSNIDLSNWSLDNAVSGSGGHLEIPAAGTPTIPAHGYFLIANYNNSNASSALSVTPDYVTSSLSLNNSYTSNGQLVLKDNDQNVIDSTPVPTSSSWPAGNNGDDKQSMERNDVPGDGTLVSNWHTCTESGCTSTAYWKVSGDNYGTPKAANLSGEPGPELSLSVSTTSASFKVENISNFTILNYALTYDTDTLPQGVTGTANLNNQDEYTKSILLGTCSTGGVCVYNTGIKNIDLKVTLIDDNSKEIVLEKTQ